MVAAQTLCDGRPVARTRSLRHPFQESRRNGRRIRPLRPHLPRTVGHGFRIRRGGKHHPQASAGQSQAAHLPARRGPRAAQPRRHLQPRSRPRRGAPATAARRGDRRLQHRQEHGHTLRPGAGRLPQMLPQPLPVRRLFHDQRRLRSGAEGSIVPDARKHHEDSGTALRIPPRAEPVPPHPAESLARPLGRDDRPDDRHHARHAARRHGSRQRHRLARRSRPARSDAHRRRRRERTAAHAAGTGSRAPHPHPFAGNLPDYRRRRSDDARRRAGHARRRGCAGTDLHRLHLQKAAEN